MISGILFSLVYNTGIKNITKFAVGKTKGLKQRLGVEFQDKKKIIY